MLGTETLCDTQGGQRWTSRKKAPLPPEELFEPEKIVAALEDLPTPQGMPTSFAIAE